MLRSFPSLLVLITAAVIAVWSCSKGTAPIAFQPAIDAFNLSPLPEITYPPYNPYRPERIALGRLLFFDPILGGESATWVKTAAGKDAGFRTNDVACGSCHHPDFGFADGRRLGSGVGGAGKDGLALGPDRAASGTSIVTQIALGTEPRNSQSILNTAFNGRDSIHPVSESFQFMDGRVSLGLEAQAQEPIVDRDEMAGDAYGRDVLGDLLIPDAIRDSLTTRIREIPEYVDLFRLAFPGEITSPEDITMSQISKAIAAYERELITPGSRYDRFVDGDFNVFNEQEKQGFLLFFGEALCGDCHSGPLLSDFSFHVQGASDGYDPGFPGKDGQGSDLGRFHADPVEFADQKFAFRTLTIRNVEFTAPYFHSGGATTLAQVVEFYNRGGRGPDDVSDQILAAAGAARDPSIRSLSLSADDIQAIVAFMLTTSAPVGEGSSGVPLATVPQRVPSGLVPPGVPTIPDPQ